MIIDTTGVHPKITLEEIRMATEFFAKELMPRAWDKLYIDINFSYLEKMHGSVERLSRYEYQIDLSKRVGRKTAITTIAHEMVHIKQMIRGELVMKIDHNKWNGVVFAANYDYYDRPWEIEAYGREVGLSYKYFNSLGKDIK